MRRRSSNDWELVLATIQAIGQAAVRYPRAAAIVGGAFAGGFLGWLLVQLVGWRERRRLVIDVAQPVPPVPRPA